MDILNFIAGAGTMLVGTILGACIRRMDDTKKKDESEGIITNVFNPATDINPATSLAKNTDPISQRY